MKNLKHFNQVGIRQRSVRAKFMRATELVFVLALGATLTISLPGSAVGQTLEWDTDAAAGANGGTGVWDGASTNWTSY